MVASRRPKVAAGKQGKVLEGPSGRLRHHVVFSDEFRRPTLEIAGSQELGNVHVLKPHDGFVPVQFYGISLVSRPTFAKAGNKIARSQRSPDPLGPV